MGKRGPKPGFKRDKRVNVNELADQAIIQASKKALADAARDGIEKVIESASVTEKVENVTEKATTVTETTDKVTVKDLKDTQTFDWDALAAQTKGAVLQERETSNRAGLMYPYSLTNKTPADAEAVRKNIEDAIEGATVPSVRFCRRCDEFKLLSDWDYGLGRCKSCAEIDRKQVKVTAEDDMDLLDALRYYTATVMPVATEPTAEWVNHPKHYNIGNIEVIDAIEDWDLSFNLGNAVKYIARAKHKGNQLQDLEKAAWYLNREIMKAGGR